MAIKRAGNKTQINLLADASRGQSRAPAIQPHTHCSTAKRQQSPAL